MGTRPFLVFKVIRLARHMGVSALKIRPSARQVG